MDKVRKFIDDLRTYDEGCEPADGWYVAYNDLQKSANTMEALLEYYTASEAAWVDVIDVWARDDEGVELHKRHDKASKAVEALVNIQKSEHG